MGRHHNFLLRILGAYLLLSILSIVGLNLSVSLPLAYGQSPPAADPGAAGAGQSKDGQTVSPTEAAKQLEALSDELFLQGMMDAFEYDPRGRRDPFVQPVLDRPVPMGAKHGPFLALQRFDISRLKLIGIIWDVKRPRAMITDPGGKIHIVGPNAKIGPRNGYIAVIREGEIVVVETVEGEGGRLASSAQVIKLAK